ncbi:hypothetical protein BU23DRAFT_464108, partial [Bimuria novae-zelandiae CBS 107.79]
LLGSPRTIEDVDVVVPKDAVAAARTLLVAASGHFTVDPRTRHTHYITSPAVEIEILSPPTLFQETFNLDTPTHSITIGDRSIRVLKPALILNAKCRSILGRSNDEKKKTDAADITFLLWWLATNNAFPLAQEVPNASKEFVTWFIGKYGNAEYWTGARFNLKRGELSFPKSQLSKLMTPIYRFILSLQVRPRDRDFYLSRRAV